MICYAILACPRSGTGYLCDLLTGTGRLGAPREYVNRNAGEIRARRRLGVAPEASYQEYVARLLECDATDNGVFGLKVFPNHHVRALQFFPITHVIFVRRRDVLCQAISYYRASATGQWGQPQRGGSHAAPLFRPSEILSFKQKIENGYQMWKRWMQKGDFRRLNLCYEDDLCAHPSYTVARVCEFLGVSSEKLPLLTTNRTIQRDEMTDDWKRRLAGFRTLV